MAKEELEPKPCPFCGGQLLDFWQVDRPDGGFGVPIREHHTECDTCGFHALFTEKLDRCDRTEQREIKHRLRQLGYLEGR